MITYKWEFGSADAGLEFIIEWDDLAQQFTVTCLAGSFDLNALWFSNGDTTSDGDTSLVKSDNSLNMNGDTVVWDDGASSLETIIFDLYGKLSSPGLGSDGEEKSSFIEEGETATFTLADFGLTTFDPTIYGTLGVRATSVNGTGEIKWVDETANTGQGPLVPGIAQVTNTPVDEFLSDITGTGSFGRIVYGAPGAQGLDVLAFTYTRPAELSGVLTGTFQVVNAGPGDQTDPHVANNIVSYTSSDPDLGTSEIRYFDFFTNTDHLVPTAGLAFLSDVDAGRIVYTQVGIGGSQIGVYNTADNSTVIIPGAQRQDASIGSTTVAFEDNNFGATSELVVHDLATATTTRLTNDSFNDINPSVSADGNYVVFQKCFSGFANCDIFLFQQTSPGVWSELANISSTMPANSEDVNPSISGDGRFVAFSSTVAGSTDIYVWDRDTNTMHQFNLPGFQRNPAISEDGRHISFESNPTGAQYDIYVADNPLHSDFII